MRLAGDDRYETAIAIAKEGWTQSNYAILVCGDNYPDALVATPVAKKYNAPILLSYKDSLPAVTKQELTNLNVKEVILVGGTGVLSSDIQTELQKMGINSQRLAGKDRYETSLVVASQFNDISQIAVATGEDFADALSIAPIAANQNIPILLVPRDALSDDAGVFIKNQDKLVKTYIVGNIDQISDNIAYQFPNVERITGKTKYERNIAVLNKFSSLLGNNHVYAATGNDFADALTGTALAAKNNAPIVLVDTALSNMTREYLNKELTDKQLTILGGTGVISDSFFQNLAGPVFGSSFIQSWYCEDWDTTRWLNEFSMLKDIGINEIIIQNTVDTTPTQKFASYNTSLDGYTSNDVDLLDHALTAADTLGMKVRVGTGDNAEWWSKGGSDQDWLANEAKTNKLIIDEITSKYATHPSFGGWYLPYEISNITATTLAEQANLNGFIKSIATEMKLKTPGQTVMISPFYNSKLAVQSSLDNWTEAMENIFKGTGVDILALQDSVGVGYNPISQLSSIFASTKKGTDAAGLKLYANTETFTSSEESDNVTAPLERITSQIAAEKEYVAGHVAFSINHYQGKYSDDSAQVNGYNEYRAYYLAQE
jgi:putative cell wall-binding protein